MTHRARPVRSGVPRISAIYNVYGAAIRGQPVVLATEFGPLKVVESDLVDEITLV